MFFNLIKQWIFSPISENRLFRNFVRQDFIAQFSSSIFGFFWLFLTPIVHIIIYSFVFSYIFQLRSLPEFGETQFVIFMMIGYLPWIAFAEAVSKSPNLLLEKGQLIKKVMYHARSMPIVWAVIKYN